MLLESTQKRRRKGWLIKKSNRSLSINATNKKCQSTRARGLPIKARNKKGMADQAKKQERSVDQGKRGWQIKKSNRSADLANTREEEVGQLSCRRTEVCCSS